MELMDNLTKIQRNTLSFIEDFVKDNGYSPSIREVMEGMGHKSSSATSRMLDRLIEKGYLNKGDGTSRSISLNNDALLVRELKKKLPNMPESYKKSIERTIKILEK